MSRGQLRVYLGAAPGVGKTFRMLGEGQRRRARGGDVVVALLETHGRLQTAAAAEGLETVPRVAVDYRGGSFGEMDVDGVIARRPELALVDELAHTNIPGSRNEKRWQDVLLLLDAGINVITTVNIQHLESVNDVVERITGVPQRETVPDAVVRAADQIELVDMTAEALRRRLAHGNVYAPDKVDAALAQYFRVGNLTALRELALLWLADSVEEGLQRYREAHHIDNTWETRERVVVALTGGPEGELLVRRAARIAARGSADLLAVHVARTDGLSSGTPAHLPEQQALVESLGGRYQVLSGDDAPEAVLQFARAENATQLVVGASRRPRLQRVLGGLGTAAAIVDRAGPIDVHIVTHGQAAQGRLPTLRRGLTRRRQLLGLLLTGAGLAVLTPLLATLRADLTLSSTGLVYLLVVVAVALVGGLAPAVIAAVAASLALNYWFTPPIHSLTIADHNNALALVVFVLVGVAVSLVVDLAATRTKQALRSAAEAEVLSGLASTALTADEPLAALTAQAGRVFGAESVTVQVERGGWVDLAGDPPAAGHRTVEPAGEGCRLVVVGPPLSGSDARLLKAFANYVVSVRRTEELQAEATAARAAEAGDRIRAALLSAVGHDLRTPLATIKASAAALLALDPPTGDRAELLDGIDAAADRLAGLVTNLLDVGGLATVQPTLAATRIADLVDADPRLDVDLPDDLPLVRADAALARRALGLLTATALDRSDRASVKASCLDGRMEVRVVDTGPAAEPAFVPHQPLGVARGLAEAQGGSLEAEDTPGGGLTLVLSLPLA